MIVEIGIVAKGKVNLTKYLAGKKLTRNESIRAKCCDCMGGYTAGRQDCEIIECSLYPFMPYGELNNSFS